MITLRPHQQEALEAMQQHDKGQVIIPTGGGKTLCMINDAKQQFDQVGSTTIVVVAPRILLAEQLCKEFLEVINNAAVYHVHSGETEHFSSTKPALIANWHRQAYRNQLISLPITLYIVFRRVVFTSTRFILMKRTILSSVISSLPLNIFLLTLTAAIFSLLLLNTLLPSSNLG